ncbi:unnamed protein product [Plutella xylostella]|uniref:(diamondback moth) hypothetical protein n=1 Tax=Plutella xylostella TaxID=51655 RepID=A0A8S4FEV3_PLUXY|nr:unnamed protein product [Plutella xylostella]
MISTGALVFLFSTAIVSGSVIRSFPHASYGISNIRADIPEHGPFMPFGANYAPPAIVQYIINGNRADCDDNNGIIIPEVPLYDVAHQPAAIVLQDKPYLSPAFVPVSVPEPPRFVEEIKPVVIPEAPVLPPFTQPELPALTVVEPAPEPCVHDVVLTPEVAPVYVPEAPVLPPFVQPELPVFIPVEQPAPAPAPAPVIIPEAPVLPPFVQPELPTVFYEEPAPAAVIIPEAPQLPAEPCYDTVVIPEAPVLPPFVQPELPVIVPVEQPAPVFVPAPAPSPVIIPEAPVLPPFVQPELPTVFFEEIAPAPVLIPEAPVLAAEPCLDSVIIPEAPVLLPFVQPELPVVVEQPAPAFVPAPAPAPVIIPEAPVLPPFVQPELPTVFYEEPAPTAVIVPEAPVLAAEPCLDAVVIPAAPQLVVEERLSEPVKPVFTAPAYDIGYFHGASPIVIGAPLQIVVKNSPIPEGAAFAKDCLDEIVEKRVIPHVLPTVYNYVPSGPPAFISTYPVHK